MPIKRPSLLCGLTAVAAALLVACGQHGSDTAGGQASAQVSANAAVPGNLRITSYGPDHTKAGVAFNVQPGGEAALWVRLNHSLDGHVAAIDFDGTLLQGNISGNLVTAGVPAPLYAKPGTFALHVIARAGNQPVQSNDVTFKVE